MAQRAKTQSTSTATEATTTGADTVADAFIFGYPLVLMDVTRRLRPRSRSPKATARADQSVRARAPFPDASFTDVVSPNADTLYSVGLARSLGGADRAQRAGYGEALLPDADARRLDQRVRQPGNAHDGQREGKLRHRRTQVERHAAGWAHRDQRHRRTWSGSSGARRRTARATSPPCTRSRISIRSCRSARGGRRTAPPANVPVDASIDNKTPPAQQVAAMDAATFFGRLNALMMANPPSCGRRAGARAIRRRSASVPARRSTPRASIRRSTPARRARKPGSSRRPGNRTGTQVNGWDILPDTRRTIRHRLSHAGVVALIGLGANLPDDAIYPHATDGHDGAAAHRREQVRDPLRQGRAAAGEGLLVGDDVQRQAVVRREPDRSLRDRRPRPPGVR